MRTYFLNLRKKMACNSFQWRSYHLRGMLSSTPISFFPFQIKRDDVFNNCKVVYTKPLSINTFPKVYKAFSSLIGTVDPAFHLLPTFISMLHVYGIVSYQT